MRAAGPLPIAPGPMPGEAVLSWVARIAARYDLSLSELMACLRGGVGVYSPRMAALDWKEDLELEGLLARAACLDRSEIRAMRLVTEPTTNPAVWRRSALAWCPACVSDDVARHGESFERAAWQLGCYVACPSHRLFLARSCVVCGCRRCCFRPLAGRQRLVCEFCRGAVDARTAAPASTWFAGVQIGDKWIGWFDVMHGPDLALSALAMQANLLSALGGSTPTLAERCGLSAGKFIAMVTDLAGMVLPPRDPTEGEVAVPSGQIFATMEGWAVFELLGIVAALIESALKADTHARPALMRRMPDGHRVPIDLAWLSHRLADSELLSLRGRATQWGLVIGRAIHDAISLEVSERRRRAVICERKRLDAMWLRQASKRYRAEAIKRIRARAKQYAAQQRSKHSSVR
jgi:TniQ